MTAIAESRPVAARYSLDRGVGRYRIGLIVLASDNTIERDFMNMRPSDEVAIFASRILNANPCTLENLRTMAPRITEATALLIPDGDLQVVAYGCTSATVAIGYEAVAERILAARPEATAVTPITAALAAFDTLELQRIAVLTPYVDEVSLPMVRFLEARGKDVVGLTSFRIEDDNDMCRIPTQTVIEAALEADRPDADAVFISCTAVRAVDCIARIEDALGKPVISSNLALFWQA
ncbi:MAG TPA: Asp/Glu racemase, partial [Kiloniellaceae bacterium]|nr:Asp/Glu racemase [Kiloniellaceae bacterium]